MTLVIINMTYTSKLFTNLKLPTNLIVQAADKSTKFMFAKTVQSWFFLNYGFKSDCPGKF